MLEDFSQKKVDIVRKVVPVKEQPYPTITICQDLSYSALRDEGEIDCISMLAKGLFRFLSRYKYCEQMVETKSADVMDFSAESDCFDGKGNTSYCGDFTALQ